MENIIGKTVKIKGYEGSQIVGVFSRISSVTQTGIFKGFDNAVKYIIDNNLTDMRVYSTDGKSNFSVDKEGNLCNLNVRCTTSTFEVPKG